MSNRSFDNIEYRPFPGQTHRVGHAPLSGVWHIRQSKTLDRSGRYYVTCQTNRAAGIGAFFAPTLAEVSAELRSR